MARRGLAGVIEKIPNLELKTREFLTLLTETAIGEGQAFDVRKNIKGTDSSSSQIISRTLSALSMIADFDKGQRADLVPRSTINALNTAMQDLEAGVDEVALLLRSQVLKQGGFQSFDYSTFHGTTTTGHAHNLHAPFVAVFNASEEFLEKFFAALLILKPRGAMSFQAAASSLEALIANISDALSATQSKYEETARSLAELETVLAGVADSAEEAAQIKERASAREKAIAQFLEEATEQHKAIDKINNLAAALGESVEEYQSDFDQFQEKLDERETHLSSGNEAFQKLVESFESQRDNVEALINRSEEMLSSSTTAALATHFEAMRTKLTKELGWARCAFYIGIGFLFISALPLMLFVLLPIIAIFTEGFSEGALITTMQYGPTGVQTGWQYLGQVLARVAILFPAAWFVSFTAIRHSSLFRLREHYAYKYSMAVSVEGFKKQAPEYEQEIAAMVLEQLAFNPADKLTPSKDIKEGQAPAISDLLLGKIRKGSIKPKDKGEASAEAGR